MSNVCTIQPFLRWDCLLSICSTYTNHGTQEVLEPLSKVATVKYWISPSVFDSILWSFLIDQYPLSPWTHIPDPLPDQLRKEKLLQQQYCKVLARNLIACMWGCHTLNPPWTPLWEPPQIESLLYPLTSSWAPLRSPLKQTLPLTPIPTLGPLLIPLISFSRTHTPSQTPSLTPLDRQMDKSYTSLTLPLLKPYRQIDGKLIQVLGPLSQGANEVALMFHKATQKVCRLKV